MEQKNGRLPRFTLPGYYTSTGIFLNIIVSTLIETCRHEEALRCIHVALLCTQVDAGICPTISTVIMMISNSYLYLRIPIEHDDGLLGLYDDSQRLGFRHEGKVPSKGFDTIFLTRLLCFSANIAIVDDNQCS